MKIILFFVAVVLKEGIVELGKNILRFKIVVLERSLDYRLYKYPWHVNFGSKKKS